MNTLDYLLLAIVGLSAVLSLWRGFVREAISLIGLVASFFIASRMAADAASLLGRWIQWQALAELAGFALVFVLVMFAFGLVGALVRKLIDAADLTATDRLLGMLFGIARGVLLIGLVFLGYTSLTDRRPAWIKQSLLAPYAIELGQAIGKLIPKHAPLSTQAPAIADIPARDREQLSNLIQQLQRKGER